MSEYLNLIKNNDLDALKKVPHQELIKPFRSNPEIDSETNLFFKSCSEGKLQIVKYLSSIPLVLETIGNAKLEMNGRTSFHQACFYNHHQVVRHLLTLPLILKYSLNEYDYFRNTPLQTAISFSCFETIGIILHYKHLINLENKNIFSQKLDIDLKRKPLATKLLLCSGIKVESELISEYSKNPDLFYEWSLHLGHPAILFLLIVGLCDGYLTFKDDRFFKICISLPMELQMLISNYVYNKNKIIISSKDVCKFTPLIF